ncbi:SIS domain-containing protein [Methanobrevibacter sp.]|uniref:SIS domain-containing protein n=1 Tax=Methanobrevibacter sp. TaxID=66852 RepID=UPI003890E9A4
MSDLKYMNLSLDSILKSLNRCRHIVQSQESSISRFGDIILDASNRRWDPQRGTTIFLAGAGRSGFVAKSFAMRLMHLGFYVYVLNESIAPPVNDGDIIIIISKSGKSNSITQIVDDSQFANVKLLAVCGDFDSNLAKKADANIVIESVDEDSANLDDDEIGGFIDSYMAVFESNDEVTSKLEMLPRHSVDFTDKSAADCIGDLDEKTNGIKNIYLPLELVLMGTTFEISALVLLDALVSELMARLNLRENDLIGFHDVLSSSI